MKKLVLNLVAVYALTFVVAAVVSYLYSLLAHGQGAADWGMAVRLGIILAIVLVWMDRRMRRT